MEAFLQQMSIGLSNGAVYSLIALALVLVHTSTGLMNFAQGSMATFSAYVYWQLMRLGAGFGIAVVVTAAVAFITAAALEKILFSRPQLNAPLPAVVVLIGLLSVFHSLCGIFWGYTIKEVASPFSWIPIQSHLLDKHQVGTCVTVALLLASVTIFFRLTSTGLAMRAAMQNPVSAQLSGISITRTKLLGWGLAGSIGAMAGIIAAPTVYLEPNMMAGILVYAFAGALVGGINNAPGAVFGGFLIGVVENAIAYFGQLFERATSIYVVGNGEKLSVALGLLLIVLLFKPNGIFEANKGTERV